MESRSITLKKKREGKKKTKKKNVFDYTLTFES